MKGKEDAARRGRYAFNSSTTIDAPNQTFVWMARRLESSHIERGLKPRSLKKGPSAAKPKNKGLQYEVLLCRV